MTAKTASDDNIRIVDEVERTHLLDNIIRQITNNSQDMDLQDLKQDIMLSLLMDSKLVGLYENKQLNFYLAKIVMNNIASSTSPFYRIYKRPRKLCEPINNDIKNNLPDC